MQDTDPPTKNGRGGDPQKTIPHATLRAQLRSRPILTNLSLPHSLADFKCDRERIRLACIALAPEELSEFLAAECRLGLRIASTTNAGRERP
jgi:hypothetical protein